MKNEYEKIQEGFYIKIKIDKEYIDLISVDLDIRLVGIFDKEKLEPILKEFSTNNKNNDSDYITPDYVEIVDYATKIADISKIDRCIVEVLSNYLYDLGLKEILSDINKIKSFDYEILSKNFENETLFYNKNTLIVTREDNLIYYKNSNNMWKPTKEINTNEEIFNNIKEIANDIVEELGGRVIDIIHKPDDRLI